MKRKRQRKEDRVKRRAKPRRRATWPERDRAGTGRSLRTTQRRRREGYLDRSWTTTRTGRTRPTSRGRACSSSTTSGDTLRRRRGLKVGTESCGRTRVAGTTTGSGRRSRRPKAARSSSPSTATTSGTAAAPESGRTGNAGRDRVCLQAETSAGGTEESDPSDPGTAEEEAEEELHHPPHPLPIFPSLPISGAATPPDSLPPAADHPTPSRITCNIRLSPSTGIMNYTHLTPENDRALKLSASLQETGEWSAGGDVVVGGRPLCWLRTLHSAKEALRKRTPGL